MPPKQVRKDFIITTLNALLKSQGSDTMLGRMSAKYDPFMVLISTILSARSKDEVTEVIAGHLFQRYPDVNSLAAADEDDVKKIIRRIGFYNVKSKNIINTSRMLQKDFSGKVPDLLEKLITFPGVGRKVANCVLVYAFKKDAIPVDTHVHRISNRLGWVSTGTPENTEKQLEKIVPKSYWQLVNDTFVTHGKKTCLPISPLCSKCPILHMCRQVDVKTRR